MVYEIKKFSGTVLDIIHPTEDKKPFVVLFELGGSKVRLKSWDKEFKSVRIGNVLDCDIEVRMYLGKPDYVIKVWKIRSEGTLREASVKNERVVLMEKRKTIEELSAESIKTTLELIKANKTEFLALGVNPSEAFKTIYGTIVISKSKERPFVNTPKDVEAFI